VEPSKSHVAPRATRQAQLDDKHKERLTHQGRVDATVPIADSRELAADRARLVEVPGGSHGLGTAAADGLLSSVVLDALAKKYGAGRLGEVFLFES